MGEIKSTMDIIMEKTKGMTLTEEEKRDIEKREVEGKVQGLTQKLMDGVIDVAGLNEEMAGFREQNRHLAKETLQKEVISRLDPLADNANLLEVFREVLGSDPSPLSQALSEFRDTLTKEASQRQAVVRAQLGEKGVSGEAVVPNLNANPDWKSYLQERTTDLKQRLSSVGKDFE